MMVIKLSAIEKKHQIEDFSPSWTGNHIAMNGPVKNKRMEAAGIPIKAGRMNILMKCKLIPGKGYNGFNILKFHWTWYNPVVEHVLGPQTPSVDVSHKSKKFWISSKSAGRRIRRVIKKLVTKLYPRMNRQVNSRTGSWFKLRRSKAEKARLEKNGWNAMWIHPNAVQIMLVVFSQSSMTRYWINCKNSIKANQKKHAEIRIRRHLAVFHIPLPLKTHPPNMQARMVNPRVISLLKHIFAFGWLLKKLSVQLLEKVESNTIDLKRRKWHAGSKFLARIQKKVGWKQLRKRQQKN